MEQRVWTIRALLNSTSLYYCTQYDSSCPAESFTNLSYYSVHSSFYFFKQDSFTDQIKPQQDKFKMQLFALSIITDVL
jgi:hypothetical protein